MYIDEIKTYSVCLNDKGKALAAYVWCEQNLPDGSWWYVGMRPGTKWQFEFDEEKLAAWFILKWS